MSLRNSWVSGLVLIGAGVIIAVGSRASAGSFTFSSPVSPGAVNSGLLDSVYHLGQTTFPFETGDQTTDAATITAVATFAATNAPNYSFVNTSDSFSYNQGPTVVDPTDEEPTNLFLGSDAAGQAAVDTTPIETSIFDAEGFVLINQAGTYTIDSSQADDGVRVYVGGTGTPGSGTAVFERNYQFFSNPPTDYSGPTDVTFTEAGYYPVEVLYYNNYSGGNGFAGLNLSATNDENLPPVSYAYVPEPASIGLLVIGTLFAGSRRWVRSR
jgi:GLEYA domain